MILFSSSMISCGPEIILNEFPKEDFDKVVAYKMLGREGEVIEDGKISSNVTGKGKTLEEKEVEELLNIFNDKSTYGGISASCFKPHVGYVFYNQNNKVSGYATICLACNNMITNPDIEKVYSVRKDQRS